MATYTVKWSTTGQPDGKPAIIVPEKTFNDTSTSLVLTGKGLNNYGLFQQENFLKLLENFAGPTPPPNPTVGQLWYDTSACALKVYSCNLQWELVGSGGGGPSNIVVGSLTDYMGSDGLPGFAERINRILGSPSADGGVAAEHQFGWGQTDYVPTFEVPGGALDALAISRQPDLPAGLTFPTTFNNSAWAIAISRLRKALRQTGLAESQTSTVGFIDDGQPSGSGNTLANYYNNLNTGPLPYQGLMPNISSGWGTLSQSSVEALLVQTEDALDELEAYRFSLGPAQTEIQTLVTRARVVPPANLFIPSAPNSYIHSVEIPFGSHDAARAFFNSGGQIQFNMNFAPSSITPSNAENAWSAFLNHFSGITFDYKGVKINPSYASPSFTPEYLVNYYFSAESIGFYDLTTSNTVIFKRDVLDTPSIFHAFLYDPTPPTNGGLIIYARYNQSTGTLIFDIHFMLRNITTGSVSQNDTTDTQLNGTLTSSLVSYRANNLNCNSPTFAPLTVVDGGTFVTDP